MSQPDLLIPLSAPRGAPARLSCVALTHNEARILPQFLDHYRALGVEHFLIVDDRSDDGSREFLEAQPDVSVFAPVDGSSYSRDKRHWRSQLLDRYCDGAWVVVPDIDEHLVYSGVEARALPALIADLEAEGAQALQAVMLDMYRDAPLAEHRFDTGRLIDAFPLFDGPDHHFRIATPRKFRAKYPTPYFMAFGGMRQRLFAPLPVAPGSVEARLLRRHCDIGGSYAPTLANRLGAALVRRRLKGALKAETLYNLTKIPLVRWQAGMHFYNGAHALSRMVPLSRHRGALLHFKFTNGVDQIRYIAERGEHAAGAQHYARIAAQEALLAQSPVFAGTGRYVDSGSLGRLIA